MNEIHVKDIALQVADILDETKIPYHFEGEASAILQGVTFSKYIKTILLSVQWDVMDTLYERLQSFSPSLMMRNHLETSFHFYLSDVYIEVKAKLNTTIRTNPYRISVTWNNQKLWCISIYAFIYDIQTNDDLKKSVHEYLHKKQRTLNEDNKLAWNQNQYEALIKRYGQPKERAEKIKKNPEWMLHPFFKYFGDVKGKKIAHLLGSNGIKATALSLLGANVTVIDFSKENEQYANEVSKACDTYIQYINKDVLSIGDDLNGTFDIVFMELGVLHYFLDLHLLFQVVQQLLNDAGIFILHEFHPISTKLITSKGKKHKADGNYFNPSIVESEVAFAKLFDEKNKEQLNKVFHRKWTLGEVITALANKHLYVQWMEEEPNHKLDDVGIPKTVTILAKKMK